MADIDAVLVREIIDVAKRQSRSDVHHDGRANDL